MDTFVGISAGRKGWQIGLCLALLGATGLATAQDDWASLPDPTRPSKPWEIRKATAGQAVKHAVLSLDSTIVSSDRRLAIINGKTLGIGGLINGARVKKITPYKVELEQNGQVVTLVLVSNNLVQPRDSEALSR